MPNAITLPGHNEQAHWIIEKVRDAESKIGDEEATSHFLDRFHEVAKVIAMPANLKLFHNKVDGMDLLVSNRVKRSLQIDTLTTSCISAIAAALAYSFWITTVDGRWIVYSCFGLLSMAHAATTRSWNCEEKGAMMIGSAVGAPLAFLIISFNHYFDIAKDYSYIVTRKRLRNTLGEERYLQLLQERLATEK